MGPNAGRKITLQSGQSVSIGRAAGRVDHDFADDSHMSGVHFAVECNENGCVLRDLGSSNGTLVNGARVSTEPLKNGDSIGAGNTVFFIRTVESETVASEPVAVVPKETTLQQRLLSLLRKDFQPLYALLDAACEPSVLKVLFESKEEYQSLFEGVAGAQLTHFAPYLVRVSKDSPLLDKLVQQGWGKNWGIYLTSNQSLQNLRTHFRQFLMIKMPGGEQAYFRFYDPRVLRVYLPSCTGDETNRFFGPMKNCLVEGEEPHILLHFSSNDRGVGKTVLELSPNAFHTPLERSQ